tara:strand:- start:2939 stop:3163 length:225 start_codon:yes stop_codon:yes gene_type:complete
MKKIFAPNARKLTHMDIEHERRKKEQIRARQIEAKVKWENTKTKTCPVCDNPFRTEDWEEMACSHECYREFRRV